MLTLITYPEGFNEPSLSPFCVKSMIQLDLSGLEWQPEYTCNPTIAPLGRLPALRKPEGVLPESGFIQTYLEGQGADFYAGVSDKDKRHGHALIRMIEEHLRVGIAYERWCVDKNWAHLMPLAFAGIPMPLRPAIANMARRQVRAGLKGHGIGRMSEAERMRCFAPDLELLTDHLWEMPYLLGNTPTAPDTIGVPVRSMIAGLPTDSALRRAVRENATLMAYIERGRDALYPKLSPVAAAA